MRWISRRGSASPCTGCVSMIKNRFDCPHDATSPSLSQRYLKVHDHMGSFIYFMCSLML